MNAGIKREGVERREKESYGGGGRLTVFAVGVKGVVVD